MTIYNFAYKAALDPYNAPADSDMKSFYFEPSNYPMVRNYGTPNYSADGTILYTSRGTITIQFAGLLYNRSPLGDMTNFTGTTVEFMQEWRTAQSYAKQMMWVNLWDTISKEFVKRLAVVARPVWNIRGITVQDQNITLRALDLNTRLFMGGAATVPDPTTMGNVGAGNIGGQGTITGAPYGTTSNTGDQFEGTYGYGYYGYGYYGHGSYVLSGRSSAFSISRGKGSASGTLTTNGVDLKGGSLVRGAAYALGTLSVTRSFNSTSNGKATASGTVTIS